MALPYNPYSPSTVSSWNRTLPDYNTGDFDPGKSFSVQAPGQNEDLATLYKNQRIRAQDFRSKLPQTSDTLYAGFANNRMGQLASDIQNTRKSFNRRGLLGSGMRTGTEMAAKNQTSADLQQGRRAINKSLMGTADNLENNAFTAAGEVAGMGPGLGGSALSGNANSVASDIANSQAMQGALGGFGQGLGYLGGAMMAQRRQPSYSAPTYTDI